MQQYILNVCVIVDISLSSHEEERQNDSSSAVLLCHSREVCATWPFIHTQNVYTHMILGMYCSSGETMLSISSYSVI